jgi:hypothetical protein
LSADSKNEINKKASPGKENLLFYLLFYPEDGCNYFLRNVSKLHAITAARLKSHMIWNIDKRKVDVGLIS